MIRLVPVGEDWGGDCLVGQSNQLGQSNSADWSPV